MSADFRAELQALLDAIEEDVIECNDGKRFEQARARARAALAAPAPVVGDDLPPRVGHILRLAEIIREVDGTHSLGAAALAEAILSHPGVRDCGMGTTPAPVVGVPTDDAIDDLFFAHCYTDDFGNELMEVQQFRKGARAVLARYGTTPAPAPVPVAERLPTPEDCDAWYEFSVFNEDDEEQAGGSGGDLEALRREAAHYHAVYSQDGPHTIQLRRVEVLPASALPLPQVPNG